MSLSGFPVALVPALAGVDLFADAALQIVFPTALVEVLCLSFLGAESSIGVFSILALSESILEVTHVRIAVGIGDGAVAREATRRRLFFSALVSTQILTRPQSQLAYIRLQP